MFETRKFEFHAETTTKIFSLNLFISETEGFKNLFFEKKIKGVKFLLVEIETRQDRQPLLCDT